MASRSFNDSSSQARSFSGGGIDGDMDTSDIWKKTSTGLDIYYDKGNVGIGTNDPGTTKLYVSGDSFISGNLGIGTNNPIKTLDVLGDINYSGDLYKNGTLVSIGGGGGGSSLWPSGSDNKI